MQVPEYSLYAALVLFVAYLVRGVAGFGSGLVAIPLLALRYPLPLVVPLVVLLDYLGSASQGVKNRELIRWGDLLPLIPFTVLGVLSALFLLNSLDPVLLARSLGTFVIAFAIYQLLPVPPLRGSRISSIPYGYLGGLVGTVFGTGGPFYVMYLNLRGMDKGAFRASFASYFIVDGTMRLVGYTAFGFFHREALWLAALAIPVAALGLFAGGRLHLGISQDGFKRVISVLLLASGTALILRG